MRPEDPREGQSPDESRARIQNFTGFLGSVYVLGNPLLLSFPHPVLMPQRSGDCLRQGLVFHRLQRPCKICFITVSVLQAFTPEWFSMLQLTSL